MKKLLALLLAACMILSLRSEEHTNEINTLI